MLQDIFERIDNYRGGEGEVKLKDLVLFLRGVYDNIDDNFEVRIVIISIVILIIVDDGLSSAGVYDNFDDIFEVVISIIFIIIKQI